MGKTLLHDIEHHAKDKAELIYLLCLLFTTELNPLGWQVMHVGKGNNSWRMYRKIDDNSEEVWFFTGYEKNAISVRNNYLKKRATEQFTLTTRVEVIRFVRHISKSRKPSQLKLAI